MTLLARTEANLKSAIQEVIPLQPKTPRDWCQCIFLHVYCLDARMSGPGSPVSSFLNEAPVNPTLVVCSLVLCLWHDMV